MVISHGGVSTKALPGSHGCRFSHVFEVPQDSGCEAAGTLGIRDVRAPVDPCSESGSLEPHPAVHEKSNDGRSGCLALIVEDDSDCREGHPRLERPPGVELVESPECAEWVMGAFGEQGKSLNRAALSGKLLLNFGNG